MATDSELQHPPLAVEWKPDEFLLAQVPAKAESSGFFVSAEESACGLVVTKGVGVGVLMTDSREIYLTANTGSRLIYSDVHRAIMVL